MDFSWSYPLATTSILCLCIYFLLKITATRTRKNNTNSPPEASGGWPIIGHFRLLTGPEPPYLVLSNLADKYGPIYSIRLGVHRLLVVSSWEVAKEIFTSTNDVIFSNRPQTVSIRLMGYDFAMFGFSKYGDYWRELRKICVLKLLSNQKVLTIFAGVWDAEIRETMKSIYNSLRNEGNELLQAQLDMRECLERLSLTSMARVVSGRSIGSTESDTWRERTKEFFKMMNMLTFSDVAPSLKWLDYFKGTKKAMKKTGEVMDAILQSWLDQHKELRRQHREEEDFMGTMMEAVDSIAHEFPMYDADTINKATCQTMILGGTDTVTVTLTWAFRLLLNNRHVLERAQQELDAHVGRSRNLKLSDLENLVYIQAIVKETLRLYPPTLLTPPRESSQDSIIREYQIPAGTRVALNLWKLHRDPSVWSDPFDFKPDRFLTENRDVDVIGRHFHFLPFGAGRRICPGVTFAMRFMEFTLATLLHGFDIETPNNEAEEMTGSLGTTNVKASPLQVLLRPRLSQNFYVF